MVAADDAGDRRAGAPVKVDLGDEVGDVWDRGAEGGDAARAALDRRAPAAAPERVVEVAAAGAGAAGGGRHLHGLRRGAQAGRVVRLHLVEVHLAREGVAVLDAGGGVADYADLAEGAGG